EATACGRGNLYPANGRDCFAEFILSKVEGLAMTKNTILYTRQAYVVPEKLATPHQAAEWSFSILIHYLYSFSLYFLMPLANSE
ncbi:MAG TPA: hypothetical protein VMX36_04530, partial [Sedimentisphaerales bacterium]|nr:hypothetical protein [Sedimentisphaerales bacterium]